jgi:hypothetical protein
MALVLRVLAGILLVLVALGTAPLWLPIAVATRPPKIRGS